MVNILPLLIIPDLIARALGITIQDVFDAIFSNFAIHVSEEEYNSWDERRRALAGRAYWSRVNELRHLGRADGSESGLKRIDYLGERVMFRGLEPAPGRENAWMLFIGPA